MPEPMTRSGDPSAAITKKTGAETMEITAGTALGLKLGELP